MATETITAEAAGTWQLGDRTVNRLGYGTMRLPETGGALGTGTGPADRDRAIRVLRRAVELGVNHLDTASFYFSSLRSANELLNSALSPYPEDLVIATKVGPGRDPSGDWWTARPEQLRGQVEENLRQLGRDHLDLVNLRLMPSVAKGPVAEHFGALAELREAGLIRHLGLSNCKPGHLAEAQEIAPVVCVQNSFGIGSPEEERDFLRACGEQDIAYVPFFAIARDGGSRGASGAYDERVEAVARNHGASPAQIRLAWTLHQGPHVLAIPGTGNPDHLAENVAAGALRLTDDEVALLADE
ncbi:aldo/keto reductase [Streptomyces boninensis]|uniref:aldo/keto reductase n=1 Tax=Streptomyces boninensis TaxID=2039455 RepID=UPI003B212553